MPAAGGAPCPLVFLHSPLPLPRSTTLISNTIDGFAFFELDAHGILSHVLDCDWLFRFASRHSIHHVVGRGPCLTAVLAGALGHCI